MSFVLTTDHVKLILRGNADAESWHLDMVKIFDRFGINNAERIGMFLTLSGFQSDNFLTLEEDLNFSKGQLIELDPPRFTMKQALACQYNPEKIAKHLYGEDGWTYRGRGVMHMRGADNYIGFGDHKDVGRQGDDLIKYIETRQGALASACWVWNQADVNEYADKGDIETVSERLGLLKNISVKEAYQKYFQMTNWPTPENVRKRYDFVIAILLNKHRATVLATHERNLVVGQGDEGIDVDHIQKLLNRCDVNQDELGLNQGMLSATGEWGVTTTRAVRAFQKAKGLKVDGIVGHITMYALELAEMDPPE